MVSRFAILCAGLSAVGVSAVNDWFKILTAEAQRSRRSRRENLEIGHIKRDISRIVFGESGLLT
jgi:hypothetical protein